MSKTNSDYNIDLAIKHGHQELIDVSKIAREATKKWQNQTLTKVNGSVVRLGVIEGEFHWHKHDNDDEFFYVVEGQLLIDLEGKTVTLDPGQGMTVGKAVMHKTRAPKRTVILMVETADIQPVGD
jgi:mannose-6-phosphate isomerase-like protein (cupin superfamily)